MSLNVMVHDEASGLFRELNSNFIVKQLSTGEVEVIGRFDEPTQTIVPLWELEQLHALNMGFVLSPDNPLVPRAAIPMVVPYFTEEI